MDIHYTYTTVASMAIWKQVKLAAIIPEKWGMPTVSQRKYQETMQGMCVYTFNHFYMSYKVTKYHMYMIVYACILLYSSRSQHPFPTLSLVRWSSRWATELGWVVITGMIAGEPGLWRLWPFWPHLMSSQQRLKPLIFSLTTRHGLKQIGWWFNPCITGH